jgi:hydrogenase maturation protease
MLKVIGIGNRLMMDDGIAIAVLEILKHRLESMEIEVIIGEADFQYVFHQLKEDDFVIILDAAYSDRVAGSIHSYTLQKVLVSYEEAGYQHDTSLFDLIRLYSKPQKGYFIGIEIAEAELGLGLSDALKLKFNDICLEVEKVINEIVQKAN